MKPSAKPRHIIFSRFLVTIALLGLHAGAIAQVSLAVAQTLLVKSGTWAQFADMSSQVKTGIHQASEQNRLPPQVLAQLDGAADAAFDAKLLRQDATRRLAKLINQHDSTQAVAWFDSSAGKLFAALEVAASASGVTTREAVEDGNAELSQSSQQRQDLLAQLVRLSFAAEGLTAIQIGSAIGVMEGVAKAMPAARAPNADQMNSFRQQVENQRPNMITAFRGTALSLYASMYKNASDEELNAYADFMRSQSGVVTSKALLETLDKTVTTAAQRFGQTIARDMERQRTGKSL